MSTDKDALVTSAKDLSPRLARADLLQWLPKLKPHRFGVTKLERPISIGFYDQWLADGYHGEMAYLESHRDLKADPNLYLSFAKSAIVFAIDYVPRFQDKSDYVTPPVSLRTALYTQYAASSADYHDAIRAELQPVLQELNVRYPTGQFRLAIDAEPVLERDLAVRAGLGWVGKNTCVIDRTGGSLFFIAEILTSLETNEAAVIPTDFCGSCTRCQTACPTGAIVAPKKLDARKCISYWTIESKTIAPKILSDKFGDWFFGCDICQTVCPWNEKVFGRSRMKSYSETIRSDVDAVAIELKEILESSNRQLARRFHGTPLSRARGLGLKRNALIVAKNLKLKALQPVIESLCADEKLGALAREVSDSLAAE